MAHLNWSVFPQEQVQVHVHAKSNNFILVSLLLLLFLMVNLPHTANSSNFSFPMGGFNSTINTKNDSSVDDNGLLQLTKSTPNSQINGSVGRASYSLPILLWLWDNTSTNTNTNTTAANKQVTNFTTHFQFIIDYYGGNYSNVGDGITFFLAPFDDSTAYAPYHSAGGCLGLTTQDDHGYCNTAKIKYPFVAVEFDTFPNVQWDPNSQHLGIDVNSVVSKATLQWLDNMQTSTMANAWITYNSATKLLSVFLTYDHDPVFTGNPSLSYQIDLSDVLPEEVRVGFSASTGASAEIHQILSWDFKSTLVHLNNTPTPEPAAAPSSTSSEPSNRQNGKVGQSKVRLEAGIVVGVGVLAFGLGLSGFMWWQRRSRRGPNEDDVDFNLDHDDDDLQNGTGPRKFTYGELTRATNNFAEAGKLGEGGFGGVYVGLLSNPSREIAVKKISRESKQGKKEYVSEVKIISRLRHRNLVQLLGWCHDRGVLLLVYELMPNGSLDSHLYGKKKVALSWVMRYKIAHGLSSALLYLHEEWEQCVVHRDIKSSNVMLDSNFNAKLGDFGLARLVDHELGSQTTALAGTLGYLAPECAVTGKVSKESDVFSFGVVALEIACGRRPIELKEEASKVSMVEWVWDLYGKGLLLEAVDARLEGEFNVQQIECLMVVGLWCCHPEHNLRPTMRQVLNVLNAEAPLPSLPSKFPVPVYLTPPMNVDVLSSTSSSGFTGSIGTTNSSSQSNVAPLISENANVL